MDRSSVKPLIAILIVTLITGSCAGPKGSKGDEHHVDSTENSTFPEPIGYVNDFEDILTEQEEQELTRMIMAHEALTTDQISIVTLTSITPYDNIYDYSLALANYWGVGQKGKNNGILIALRTEHREIRIQNGSGIEDRLTDAETQAIIEDVIIPRFKDDAYYEGLREGLEAIIGELQ